VYTANRSFPTRIYVNLYANLIGDVDANLGGFRADFYLYLAWRDDRFNNDSEVNLDDIWNPRMEFMNIAEGEIGSFFAWAYQERPRYILETALIDPEEGAGSWILATTRVKMAFSANLVLRNFPMDKQSIGIQMESTQWQISDMVWVPMDNIKEGIYPHMTGRVPGWVIDGTRFDTQNVHYEIFDEHYHRCSVWLDISREVGYYMLRFVAGTSFLVFMAALTVFLKIDNRLGFVQASFLGVVSWQFIIVTSSPPLG
jgi:hypothetical protein